MERCKHGQEPAQWPSWCLPQYALSLACQSFEEERLEGSKMNNDLRAAETQTSLLPFLFLAEKKKGGDIGSCTKHRQLNEHSFPPIRSSDIQCGSYALFVLQGWVSGQTHLLGDSSLVASRVPVGDPLCWLAQGATDSLNLAAWLLTLTLLVR